MNRTLPKDKTSGVISREARKLVHNSFSAERWDYHEETGSDNGRDCIIELIENEQFSNKKIEGQIKGTANPNQLKNGYFSFPLDVKTINYGLGSPIAFVLLYVTVNDKQVYYLPLQDYFIANPELFDRLAGNTAMSMDQMWSAIITLRFMRMSCCPLCSESTKTCQWML